MTTPSSLATDNLTTSLTSHGRYDYRRGVPYNRLSAQAWRDGWTEEAHLAARAASAPAMTLAMAGFSALDALDAAQRVLTQCTTTKPARRQAQIMAEAKPLIDDAIRRLLPASGERVDW